MHFLLMMNYKEVAGKILHDFASPLTALTFLAEDNPNLEPIVDDMTWRLKALRMIFLNDRLTREDIHPFVHNIQTNIEDDRYNKALLILGYLFKNKPIKIEMHANQITFSKGVLPPEEKNILVSYLKSELSHLNVSIQMI